MVGNVGTRLRLGEALGLMVVVVGCLVVGVVVVLLINILTISISVCLEFVFVLFRLNVGLRGWRRPARGRGLSHERVVRCE